MDKIRLKQKQPEAEDKPSAGVSAGKAPKAKEGSAAKRSRSSSASGHDRIREPSFKRTRSRGASGPSEQHDPLLLAWPPLASFPGLDEPLAYLALIDPARRLLTTLENFVSGRVVEACAAARAAAAAAADATAQANHQALRTTNRVEHAAFAAAGSQQQQQSPEDAGAYADTKPAADADADADTGAGEVELSCPEPQLPAAIGAVGSGTAAADQPALKVAAAAGTQPPPPLPPREAAAAAAGAADAGKDVVARAEALQRSAAEWEGRYRRLEEAAQRLARGFATCDTSEAPPLLTQLSELVLWAFCGLLVAPPEQVWAAAERVAAAGGRVTQAGVDALWSVLSAVEGVAASGAAGEAVGNPRAAALRGAIPRFVQRVQALQGEEDAA